MSHNIDLNVMNMRTDLAIDGVNNEELEKLKEEKENGIKVFTVDVTKENQVTNKTKTQHLRYIFSNKLYLKKLRLFFLNQYKKNKLKLI